MDPVLWPAIITGLVAPPLTLLIQRGLSWRSDKAKADVDEATADASAAAEWQRLYALVRTDLAEQRVEIDTLKAEVAELKDSLTEANNRVQIQASLLRSVCRWALLLRDELLKLDGHVPPMPPDVEAAITTLDV